MQPPAGVTIGGSRSPDFPPTPAAPEPWVMGCIQNVIRQSIKVVWLNGLNEITANYNQSAPMLDAFLDVPGQPQHLPFYAEVSASGDTASMGFLYGLPGKPVGVPVLRPSGSGPAWNLAGEAAPFTLAIDDAPRLSVLNFKGGGQSGMPNPVVEVQYSITLQVWVTAVPLARAGKLLPISNVKDGSQHFVLGYTDEFTLTAAYNRRAKPGVGNPSDAFWFQFDRKTSGARYD